jgi:probable HAF family extracellular repeat protein
VPGRNDTGRLLLLLRPSEHQLDEPSILRRRDQVHVVARFERRGRAIGQSETTGGKSVAFLWTREHGMRSLGTLHGLPSSFATHVNTHQRVVGHSYSDEASQPFLWTPGGGMQPLPTLGGGGVQAIDLNEFGQIVGSSATAQGANRATLWTPTAGPLAVAQQAPNR